LAIPDSNTKQPLFLLFVVVVNVVKDSVNDVVVVVATMRPSWNLSQKQQHKETFIPMR